MMKERRKQCMLIRTISAPFFVYPLSCLYVPSLPHYTRLFIAAVAPAEAISCLPLTFLATLGRPLPLGTRTGPPVLVRLLPAWMAGPGPDAIPVPITAVDCRLAPAGLVGLPPDTCRGAVPLLKAGGSGSGRLVEEGNIDATVLFLFIGDSLLRNAMRSGVAAGL